MRYRPKTSTLTTPIRTAPRPDAFLRAIEADMLKKGATAQEVALLHQCAGNHFAAATVIAMMVARVEDERLGGAGCSLAKG